MSVSLSSPRLGTSNVNTMLQGLTVWSSGVVVITPVLHISLAQREGLWGTGGRRFDPVLDQKCFSIGSRSVLVSSFLALDVLDQASHLLQLGLITTAVCGNNVVRTPTTRARDRRDKIENFRNSVLA